MTLDSGEAWAERLATTVGQQVSRYRRELVPRLSAQDLADRTAALGHEVKRSVIANLESGRRGTVTLADVLVLAAALGVPPAALAFPHDATAELELLPGHTVEPIVALDWFTGQRALPHVPWATASLEQIAEADIEHGLRGQGVRDKLDLYREHEHLLKLANTYALASEVYAVSARDTDDAESEKTYRQLAKVRREQLRLAELELERVRLDMEQAGIYLPPLVRLKKKARGEVFEWPRQIEAIEAELDRRREARGDA